MLVSPHHHLLVGSANLDDVERRSRCKAQSLALSDCKVVDAAMFADNLATGRDQLARGVGQALALLGKVGVDEALIVATGYEADFLRIGARTIECFRRQRSV